MATFSVALRRSVDLARGLPKRRRDVPKTLDRDCRHDRIPTLEMRVEDRLAVFDLLGQATDRDGLPSLAFRDEARRRDDAVLAFSPLPAFSLGDTQSSISRRRTGRRTPMIR